MSDLTTRGDRVPAIPHTLPAPPMPPAVAEHVAAVAAFAEARAAFAAAGVDDREGMFVGPPPRLPALRGADRDGAQRAADALEWQLRPVPHAVFRAWLGPVNAAVRNPQSAADFEVRVAGLVTLLDDLPAGCFTADARRSLPAFFPSAEDIRRAVEPGARRLRASLDALQAALAPPPAAAATVRRHAPTQEEIAAVQAKARALMVEAARPEPKGPIARAMPLSHGSLLAHYDRLAADGNRAAAARADAIRRSLGDAA